MYLHATDVAKKNDLLRKLMFYAPSRSIHSAGKTFVDNISVLFATDIMSIFIHDIITETGYILYQWNMHIN